MTLTINRLIAALALLAAIASPLARAGTIGLHTISDHGKSTYTNTHEQTTVYTSGKPSTVTVTETEVKYNNRNFGLYYIADNGFTVGAYRNSYDRNTLYVGYTAESREYHGFSAVGSVALATGYSYVHGAGKLRPMVMPGVKYTMGKYAVRYSVVPSRTTVLQHLSFEYKL